MAQWVMRLTVACIGVSLARSGGAQADGRSVQERLGYPASARLLVIHATPGHDLHQRIDPQPLVIVQVFPPAGDGDDALGDQRPLAVGDQLRITRIGNDSVDAIEQTRSAIHLAEQNRPGIRSDRPAGKIRDDLLTGEGCKTNRR